MGRHNQSDITTMLDTGVAIIEMFVSDNRENFGSQQILTFDRPKIAKQKLFWGTKSIHLNFIGMEFCAFYVLK